ncbi:immunoglobulin superfamily member 3-like isoform X2 [Stegostoma tigrinum]|uniref:immunoglobulin superfamily member 3-like isoform X2 n=1 Tax=Stegostoma tigrinum TaxID=3053191 RepID=UPI0028704801|nr:immunoglobulin superfamily member 3-like isoform X2 [Stegostoma tigrinum]
MEQSCFKETYLKIGTLLVFSLIFSLDSCTAQRQVKLQEGPLVRAEGHHITIQCDVSGYQGSSEQNFEWSVFRPDKPTLKIQIISSNDPEFPYAVFGERVQKNDIYIERIKGDSVLLHITKLQKSDEGMYECATPSTDNAYWGSYSAMMNLTVVPDTLSATLAPQTLDKVEGDSLELICEVSKETSQHTHVAVTWYIQKGDQKLMVISLTRDFIIRSGDSYKQKEAAGDVQLDKIGVTSFKLTISKLQLSDQGNYYCEGAEWIQDIDKSWYGLSSKNTENTTVNVKSIGNQFLALIKATEVNINVGGTLEIICTIEAQNFPDRFFSVAWFLNNREIIRFGSNAVPSFHGEYKMRESLGKVMVHKKSDRVYVLKIYQIQVEDGGTYHCQVEENEKVSSAAFSTNKSNEITITVQRPQSNFKVTAITRTPTVKYYGTFELQCIIRPINITHVPASVSWKFQPANSNDSYNLVTFTHDTAIKWGNIAENFKGKMIVVKSVSNAVRLSVSRASKLEAGKFLCIAELWGRHNPNKWVKKASATSNILEVKVGPPACLLQLTKQVTTIYKRINDITELECKILARTQNDSQFSVMWLFSKPHGPNVKGENLLNVDRNSIVQYYGELLTNSQKKMKFQDEKPSSDVYKLMIQKTDVNDSGNYYCHVTEWLLDPNNIWYKVGEDTSAMTIVQVRTADANLQISNNNSTLSINENTAVELECQIINQTQRQSQFSVTWYFQNDNPNTKETALLKADRNNILQYFGDLQVDPQKMMKFQSVKTSSNTYKLIIQKAAQSDNGVYFCDVEEWVSGTQNEWVLQGHARSGSIILQVQTPGATLHSKACASSSLFYFIFIYPFIVIIALIIVALYFYLRPKKPQKPINEKSFWTPIETFIDDPKSEEEENVK